MVDIDDTPEKMNCLICDGRVGISSRNFVSIFATQSPKSTEIPLHITISKLVEKELTEDSVHSLVTCKKCYKLFVEFEELDQRIHEIRNEIVTNYNRTMARVQEEQLEAMQDGVKDEPIEQVIDEDNIESYYIKNKHFLSIPSSDDEHDQRVKKRKFDDVEINLQQMHETGEILEEVVELTDGDVPQISIPEPSENSQEFQEYREDEIIDAGAIDDSADSDYQPSVVLEVIQNGNNEIEVRHNGEDNTTALLEAAAMAEQTIQEDGSIVYNVKLEPGLPIYKDIRQVVRGDNKNKKKPQTAPDITFPIVFRDGDQYTCFACTNDEKFTGDAKAVMAHVKNEHDLRVYICDVCGDHFRKRNELSHHLDEHVATEEGDFQCEVCNRIFSNLRLFRIHKRMHYPQTKLWTCETCGKRYSSRNLLDEHINTHTGLRPYVCKHCKKDFASKYTYRAHMKTHEIFRPRPYTCSQCDKTFMSQQNLTQHERTHTGVKGYICHLCGKAFVSPHNLEVHSIVHSGYKPFICRTCGKAFARKAEIRDHERTHTGERPYQCEFCGATFSQRSNLQSHKRATHYDDKRYKCRECNKGFKRRRLLDYHVKAVHTGERPYKCNICEATFVYPEHFKKHRRIHTGEKPYLCEVCGKAFNSRDNRNAHRFVHSDKKPYECLVCGMGFMRKPLLYAHMETQGHLNDTIVVNQPRLTTEDDQLVTLNMDGEMELIQEEDQDDETKQYIFDFKKHVILQNSEDGTIIVPEDVDGQHLIIDGQYVANGDDESTLQEIAQLSKEQIMDGEEYEEVIQENSSSIQTSSGSYQLVQVTLNHSEGEEENSWVNLVRT